MERKLHQHKRTLLTCDEFFISAGSVLHSPKPAVNNYNAIVLH